MISERKSNLNKRALYFFLMKFQAKNDRIEDHAIQKINLDDVVTNRITHTDRFLKLVKNKHDAIFAKFLDVLKAELNESHEAKHLPKKLKNIHISFQKNSILAEQPELVLAIEKSMLSNMRYGYYEEQEIDPLDMEIEFKDEYRGSFIPEYILAVSLCKVLPRKSAIKIIREYTRGYYKAPYFIPQPEVDLVDHAKQSYERSYKTHKALYLVDEGKLFFKVQRCLYADVIQDLPDKELIYYLECYGDYFNHTGKNENFVLTRSQTCMKGDPYCDFCYHDKRDIEEIIHPSPAKWEELEEKFRD